MKHFPLHAVLLIALWLSACAATPPQHTASHGKVPMPWKNLHQGDPELAGIEIVPRHEGTGFASNATRINSHPAMILYYFWDGRVRQTEFEADGRVRGESFWKKKLTPGASWNPVDFSHGSDPSFLRHRDPRLRIHASPRKHTARSTYHELV